ncbi:Hypothetical protein FKW44_007400 [Caligus rogercresseyi]|nr:Hypothetical protein FKW44_007400 [Caligus rogercresseyi]
MRNFDEVHRKELQALKFRNHQAGEPMDVDAIAAASRRRSIADLNAIQTCRTKAQALCYPWSCRTLDRGVSDS